MLGGPAVVSMPARNRLAEKQNLTHTQILQFIDVTRRCKLSQSIARSIYEQRRASHRYPRHGISSTANQMYLIDMFLKTQATDEYISLK